MKKEKATQNLYDKIHKLQASSETDSNEWEWDSPDEISCHEKEIDVIQTYAPILYKGQSSRSRPFEFGAKHINDSSEDDQIQNEIDDPKESTIIDLGFSIINLGKSYIMTLIALDLNPSKDSLPLVHPKLIDWEKKNLLIYPSSPMMMLLLTSFI